MIWLRKKRPETVPDRTDWLGTALSVGSRIVWPCDAHMKGTVGSATKQMAIGTVTELTEAQMVVRVERRSRTGAPKTGYDRTHVKLSAVGMANATVIG